VITSQDVPAELGGHEPAQRAAQEWTRSLAIWAERQLSAADRNPLLDTALPQFEKTLIQIAMAQTNGRRQDAAKLLGWGRNTLTRKMRSLHMD
jgi:two-component system nitrogen regulation response regulator GlnG